MLAVAMAYCLAGRISLLLAVPPGYASAIWPSAGIALAAVLVYGPRIWPAVWFGSLFVNVWLSFDGVVAGDARVIVAAVLIACGASVQALWSAWLLQRYRVWPNALSDGSTITRFVLLGGPVGCVANAVIGAGSLLSVGLIDKREFGFNCLNWWVGDAIGVMVVAPLLLIWSGAMGPFWRRRAIAVSVPITVALIAVIAFFLAVSNREQARIESGFQDTALNIETAIAHRMDALIAVLGSLQSLYASSDSVEAEEFRAFTRRALRINRDLLALSWNPVVADAERSAIERQQGLVFTERNSSGELVEAARRADYVVVRHIEPLDYNRDVLGFNVASDPIRQQALETARDSGQPAATGGLHLVQADSSQPGLLIVAPIYATDRPLPDPAQRRANIAGYAVGVVLVRQFLETAIGGFQLDHVSLQLYDDSSGTASLLANWAVDEHAEPLLKAERPLPFAGRDWRISIGADAEYIALHRAPGLIMMLAIGLLLCGLLGAFTLTLTGHERREAVRAAHDALTGLVNRGEFERRVSNALSSCASFGGQHALAYCDLDQFKLVNDTVGHMAGDELLKQIAGLFQTELRSHDTVARLGGDEFGLLLENCPIEKAGEIAARICADVRGFRFQWNDQLFQIGVSIGVIALDADSGDVSDAMAQADVACYTAKDLGRNRVHVDGVDSKLVQRRQTELQSVAELRNKLDNNGFLLYKQPIRQLNDLDNTPTAFELLLRLRGRDGQVLPPGGSIAAAERYGVMAEVDRWVIRHALSRSARLCAGGALISINLSANSLDDDSLADFVCAEAASSGTSPRNICFEITETAAISNLDAAVRFMHRMKRLGYRFALDDFGAGISSFRYLKTLPVNWLKMDGNLVQGVATDSAARAMVAAIQQIADTMGIATIAEWVSDDAIVDVLREVGVCYAQGFALGHPCPLDHELHALQPSVA